MGGVISSNKMISLIQLLKQENCRNNFSLWQGITVDDFADLSLSQDDITDLLYIQRYQPDNFSYLIHMITDVFSKESKISEKENSQNSNYIPVCNLLCTLLTISNDSTNYKYWFQNDAHYLSVSPILLLKETLQALLRFNDPVGIFLQESILSLRIAYIKTFLFIFHANFLGFSNLDNENPQMNSRNVFIDVFNNFNWNQYFIKLLESIPYIVLQPKSFSEKAYLFLKSLISLGIPSLYYYSSNTEELDFNLIHSAFHALLMNSYSENVISISEQIISFLYAILNKYPTFLNFLLQKEVTNTYIIFILFFYQMHFEREKPMFSHVLLLLILMYFTSNSSILLSLNEIYSNENNQAFIYNSSSQYYSYNNLKNELKMKPHRGSYADLTIEIITNPIMDNFKSYSSLIPLVVSIILNISSTTTHLSFFSANRLFILFKKMFVAKLVEKPEFIPSFEKILLSIFQFLKFNQKQNLNLLYFASENKHYLKIAKEKPKSKKSQKYSEAIMKIIQATENIILSLDENEEEKTEQIQAIISSLLLDDKKPPAKFIEDKFNKKFQYMWHDWFRVLFWLTFPEDTEKASLRFSVFKLTNRHNKLSFQFSDATNSTANNNNQTILQPKKSDSNNDEKSFFTEFDGSNDNFDDGIGLSNFVQVDCKSNL